MRRLLFSLLALATVACGSRGARWDEPLEAEGPFVAADRLVWLNRTASLLVVLDPQGGDGARAFDVVGRIRGAAPWSGGMAILGGRGDAPTLEIVRLPGGERRRIALGAAWDEIAVAPDGTHAVLRFDPDVPPAAGAPPVRNLNEIGVVDLAAGSATTVVLQTEALVPRAVVFQPGGTLAALLFDNAIALVDTAAPARRVQVPLKLRDGTALRPAEALFSPDGSFLFVRAVGSEDVLTLELLEAAGALDVSINFLFVAGGRSLQDIAVAEALGNAVVALYASHVALLDATGDSGATHVAALEPDLDRITDLGDGLLLLTAQGFATDRLSVAAWDPAAGRLVVDRLERPLAGAPVVANGEAFLPQQGGTTGALTVARVERDPARLRLDLQALQVAGQITSTAVDGASGVVFLGLDLQRPATVDDTATGGVAAITAGSLASDGLLLDAPVRQVGVVGGSIYALHDDRLGDVTLAPLRSLRREDAVRYEGVLLGGLFDRGEE
ncbi:hypothetical protein [Vulgatibacter sp.]|uniref:hypothetical protein n=1 Tax=Vulgatibacter sp. TaxID=1971226 RepID=UPI003564C35F